MRIRKKKWRERVKKRMAKEQRGGERKRKNVNLIL